MTLYDPIAAFKALITAKWTYANINTEVTGTPLDGIIQVYTQAEFNYAPSTKGNGFIIILDSAMGRNIRYADFRTEIFTMNCSINYPQKDGDADTNDNILVAFMTELDRCLNDNNDDAARTAEFDISFTFDTNITIGQYNFIVTITRKMVAVDT